MKEIKYVKFKVDMYSDTKFKIIDTKPERDLIHYVWSRVIVLAGKSNLEGELYFSKNIPYTVETLAIEINRDAEKVKSALEVLIELEMIEFIQDKFYKVKNFAKHQNIKSAEKKKSLDKDVNGAKQEAQVNSELKNEITVLQNEQKDKIIESNLEDIEKNDYDNVEITSNEISKNHIEISNNMISENHIDMDNKNIDHENTYNNLKESIPILLETNKNKKKGKRSKQDNSIKVIDEAITDNSMFCITKGELPLGRGEKITAKWSFG